jgi:HTH-type transcriptional regulator/antitoxin HigA
MTARVKVLTTRDDYEAALKRIDLLMARDREDDVAELEALALLVESYEKKEFPIPALDPIEAILSRMRQLEFTQADLAREVDIGRSHISEILGRRRKLSLDAVRKISKGLEIPAEILIQPYDR